MSQGPLAVAWARYVTLIREDGRVAFEDLDLDTWKLMFMEGARVALVNSKDGEAKTMMLGEVIVFELERMKSAGKKPALVVIDGGRDADGSKGDRHSSESPLAG